MTATTGTYTINKSLISEDLAKKMKEAGFPQEGCGGFTMEGERLYFPTLSELIEECGNGFNYLQNESEKYPASDTPWLVVGVVSHNQKTASWGRTPEEAVAILWLNLNKDKTTE